MSGRARRACPSPPHCRHTLRVRAELGTGGLRAESGSQVCLTDLPGVVHTLIKNIFEQVNFLKNKLSFLKVYLKIFLTCTHWLVIISFNLKWQRISLKRLLGFGEERVTSFLSS